MPAIQTYEAREIREGFVAYRREHKGVVRNIPADRAPGTRTLIVDCTVHGILEVWSGIPEHSAVHAERAV
jgi:hypothetical protein